MSKPSAARLTYSYNTSVAPEGSWSGCAFSGRVALGQPLLHGKSVPGLPSIELFLDRFEFLKNRRQVGGLIDVPVLLRRKANTRNVRATALVGATER
ncbi:hypothetical protein [Phyllobacterium sp. K27]